MENCFGPLGINFNGILIECHIFSFKKTHSRISGKWQSFLLGPSVLSEQPHIDQMLYLKLNLTQLKNGLFDIIIQDNNHVMTTINARY